MGIEPGKPPIATFLNWDYLVLTDRQPNSKMMTYHYRQLIHFLDWKVDLAQHIILAPSLDKHRKPVKRKKRVGNLENVERQPVEAGFPSCHTALLLSG